MRFTFALLLLAALSATAPGAGAAEVECRVDLDRGTFQWILSDGTELPPLNVAKARERLLRVDSLLVAGEAAATERRTLGQEIFGPYQDQIADASDWKFVSELVMGVPGPLGVLGTLELAEGGPALARHAVSLGWPLPLRVPEPRPAAEGGALLLCAPFAPGVDPLRDDPDTLRRALEGAVRSVRLVPRNDTDAQTLRRALEESAPGLWWLRGDAGQAAGLAPAFGALPPGVVWTVPARAAGPPALTPMTFASAGTGPAWVVVSTRAVPESALAPLARRFADALARGTAAGAALHEAQRHALAEGAGLRVASALVLVGRAGVGADLDRASWLRRLLR